MPGNMFWVCWLPVRSALAADEVDVGDTVVVTAHLEHEVVDHTVEAGSLEVEGLSGLAGTLLA